MIMYGELKEKVYLANMRLPKENLVKFTWGNVSQVDRKSGVIAIKPSGVEYDVLSPDDIVVVDIESGRVIQGNLNPSSDLATHLVIARRLEGADGIVHTHSKWATIFAQAGRELKAYGTTHADSFYGSVPCTREMTDEEIDSEYEYNTGLVIAETFKNISPVCVRGVLVRNHGPFIWGRDADEAVDNAVILEELCYMAAFTELLGKKEPVKRTLLDKHFFRKHGNDAYYGQKAK